MLPPSFSHGLLAMSWNDMSLQPQRLAANASAICSQYFSFACKAHEPMTQFLVREGWQKGQTGPLA